MSERPLVLACAQCGAPTTRDICGKCSETPFVPYISESVQKARLDEAVNRPKHYTAGKIEVIDAIEDWKLGYHLGNVVKYVARAGKKDASKTLEDLLKAQWYLARKISRIQNGTTD